MPLRLLVDVKMREVEGQYIQLPAIDDDVLIVVADQIVGSTGLR